MRSPHTGPESAVVNHSHLLRTGLAVMLLAAALYAYAVDVDTMVASPNWLQLCPGLFGGLAL